MVKSTHLLFLFWFPLEIHGQSIHGQSYPRVEKIIESRITLRIDPHKEIQKRTDDSIIFNSETETFAIILAIIVVDEQLYFLRSRFISQKTHNTCHRTI